MRQMMKFGSVLFSILVSAAQVSTLAASESVKAWGQDPLLSQMAGEWRGEGYRTFPEAGKKAILQATVRSSIDETGRLVSRNQVVEQPVGPIADPSEPKEYVRLYWVRLKRRA